MALINQNTLFDRLQLYIDRKIEDLPKELEDLFQKYGLDQIMDHIEEISIVGLNINEVVTVGNNMTYVIWTGHEIDSVKQCALNLDDIRNYSDTYYGPLGKDPVKRPDGSPMGEGDMYFNTVENAMMVLAYNDTGWQWIEAGSPFDAISNSAWFIATAGQTTFDVEYDPGNIDVYVNGNLLYKDDYTALDGKKVVLDNPLIGGEEVYIRSFGTFKIANHYTKKETLINFALKEGSPIRRFHVDYANEPTHAVNISKLEMALQNYAVKGHNHDTAYFREDEFISAVDPVVGNPGKPIITSSLTGKIDSTLLDICGYVLQGNFTPSLQQEYPDTSTKDYGAFWVIDGVDDTNGYTYNTGDLSGETVYNNNLIMYGKDSWVLMKTVLDPEVYVKRDGSTIMVGDLSFGNQYLPTNLVAPQVDSDAANKVYVDDGLADKLNISGGKMEGHIELPEAPEPQHAIRRDYVDSLKDQYALKEHTHDFDEVIDSISGDDITTALSKKAEKVDLDAHKIDTNNPHNVTATQLGVPKGDWYLDQTDPANPVLVIQNINVVTP